MTRTPKVAPAAAATPAASPRPASATRPCPTRPPTPRGDHADPSRRPFDGAGPRPRSARPDERGGSASQREHDRPEGRRPDLAGLRLEAEGEGQGCDARRPRVGGLTDWVKHMADQLADQGYVALAVDLFKGKSTSNPDEAKA